jgi:hypothetical protein
MNLQATNLEDQKQKCILRTSNLELKIAFKLAMNV